MNILLFSFATLSSFLAYGMDEAFANAKKYEPSLELIDCKIYKHADASKSAKAEICQHDTIRKDMWIRFVKMLSSNKLVAGHSLGQLRIFELKERRCVLSEFGESIIDIVELEPNVFAATVHKMGRVRVKPETLRKRKVHPLSIRVR